MPAPTGDLGGRPTGVPEEVAARSPSMSPRSRRATGIVNTGTPGYRKILPQFETADRPPPGILGRAIWDVDEDALYVDNVSAWIRIGGFGSNVWNEETTYNITGDAFLYWRLTLGPGWLVSMPPPQFGGQLLTIVIDYYTSGSGIFDASLYTGAYSLVFRLGANDYTTMTFDALGDCVMLQGVHREGNLIWKVVSNNGCDFA